MYTRLIRTVTSCRSRRRNNNLVCLRLEDRLTPTMISWDGGAGTMNWADANNWITNTLPGPGDDVVIGPAYSGIIVTSFFSDVSIKSLTSSATVSCGSTFTIAAASSTAGLEIYGILAGAGNLTVTSSFTWNAGDMTGTGKTILANSAI